MYSLIVATDNNGGIGKDGKIPWTFPADMQMFKLKTTGSIVVMGRKTWESIPTKYKPLPGRKNVVITHNTNYIVPPKVNVFHTFPECVQWLNSQNTNVFIIGGKTVYDWFMKHNLIKDVCLTVIHQDFKCDTTIEYTLDFFKQNNWFCRTAAQLSDQVCEQIARIRLTGDAYYELVNGNILESG
ncbi:dihydrofolate reductase [bacterium]|nr:dihydrofolate reductase [bacterium]